MARVLRKNIKKIKSRRRINKVKKATFIDYIKNIFNNKGFTLIEVLATIFVVSLVFGVGFSFVTRTINESKSKSNEISLANVRSGAELYVKEYSDDIVWKPEKENNNLTGNYKTCVLLSDLVDSGFLKESSVKGLDIKESVILTKDGNGNLINEKLDDVNEYCSNNGISVPNAKTFCREDVYYTGDVLDVSQLLVNKVAKPLIDSGVTFNASQEVKNAGDYEIIASLANVNSGAEWKDGSQSDKKIVCHIKRANPYFAMNPTGISSDDVKVGDKATSTLQSNVNGYLSLSNSNKDYVNATLKDTIGVDNDSILNVMFLAKKNTSIYLRTTLRPVDIKNYNEKSLTYTIGDIKKRTVKKPNSSLCRSVGYNGQEQLLIDTNKVSDGYTLFDVNGTNYGTYTITAKINYGYYWEGTDNDTSDVQFNCSIKDSYIITYNGNGNTGGTMGNQTCKHNEKCTLFANKFVKKGYVFDGWSTSVNGNKKYDNVAVVENLGDTTLYARWIPAIYEIELNNQNAVNPGTLNLWYKYNTRGGDCSYYTDNKATVCLNNSTIVVPSKTGYTFSGYYVDINGGGVNYINNSGVVLNDIYTKLPSEINSSFVNKIILYAKWNANIYNISYSLNNGSIGSNHPASATYDSVFQIDNSVKTVTVIGDANGTGASVGSAGSAAQTFAGWTSSGLNTDTAYYGNSSTAVTSKWSSASTKVSGKYFKNLRDDTGTVTMTANWTSVAVKLPTLSKTGYTCKWYTDKTSGSLMGGSGASWTPSATSATSITAYARCNPNTYIIKFNKNGGSGSMDDLSMTYGVARNLTENSFSRAGYTFNGWNTKANGSGESFSNKETVSNLATSGTVTLYAQWRGNSYTIKFDSNGGTGSMDVLSMTYGVARALPGNKFSKTDYVFTGWNTKANGSGRSFSDKETVSDLATSGTVTLYAQWNANTYTIVFNKNEGTGSMSNQVATSGKYTKLNANQFKRVGYTFEGWAETSGGAVKYRDGANVNYNTSGTVNLYAKWKAKTITITFNCNGGSGGNTQTFTYGKGNQNINHSCSRVGYTGSNWYLETAFIRGGYNWNFVVTNDWINDFVGDTGNVSITLYAKWTANTYYVKFNGNGNTGGSMSDLKMTYDVAVNLPSNGFTKAGYAFAGWAETASGTVKYSNNHNVANFVTSGTMNLYAKWTQTDYTAPTCGNVTYSPALTKDKNNDIYWINSARTVTVACTDNASGCNTVSASFSTTTKNGTVQISDGVGNTRDCSVTPYVDVTPPTIAEITYKSHSLCSSSTGKGSFVKSRDAHSGISRTVATTSPSKYGFNRLRYDPSKIAVGAAEQNEIACEQGSTFPNNNNNIWTSIRVYDMAGNCTKLNQSNRRLRATDSNFTQSRC